MVIGRFEIKGYTQFHHERGKSSWEANLALWPHGGRVNIPVSEEFAKKHEVGSQITLSARGLQPPKRNRSDDL